MSAGKSPPGAPQPQGRADGTGAGASGEGAGSALEAMLRKRQLRVDQPSEPTATPAGSRPDGEAAKE
ncbi:hypothetical protein ACFPOE_07680 [Caenimonas terrae]|uniref:Uncharacterized protein n=1 Tax=Caenimonas terrae TaxID=696074 RepID=A0ABW0NEP7_9BURK